MRCTVMLHGESNKGLALPQTTKTMAEIKTTKQPTKPQPNRQQGGGGVWCMSTGGVQVGGGGGQGVLPYLWHRYGTRGQNGLQVMILVRGRPAALEPKTQ